MSMQASSANSSSMWASISWTVGHCLAFCFLDFLFLLLPAADPWKLILLMFKAYNVSWDWFQRVKKLFISHLFLLNTTIMNDGIMGAINAGTTTSRIPFFWQIDKNIRPRRLDLQLWTMQQIERTEAKWLFYVEMPRIWNTFGCELVTAMAKCHWVPELGLHVGAGHADGHQGFGVDVDAAGCVDILEGYDDSRKIRQKRSP